MQAFTVLCAMFHAILCKKLAIVNSSLKNEHLIVKNFPQN